MVSTILVVRTALIANAGEDLRHKKVVSLINKEARQSKYKWLLGEYKYLSDAIFNY